MRKIAFASVSLSASILLFASVLQSQDRYAHIFTAPPTIVREFRGVWVATVANIDWPSKPGLSTTAQQAELLAILDRAAELNLNAVVLQVRPAADAMYASRYEPWAEYLTGEMGKAPDPLWDPLAFAVSEAHKRGLELHAWFNPYRALHPSAKSPVSPTHVSVTHPELVRRYGTHLWLDPGEDLVRAHSIKVILDVVHRYDVDGIHIDDYFYPYKERDSTGALIDFPDSASFTRYLTGGGQLSRDDWRRNNVDRFVCDLYSGIKSLKPRVKFGVSPFGIWRPGYPEQTRGFDAFQEIYADSRKWLMNGCVDYFVPQLYWKLGRPTLSFTALLDWWVSQNTKSRQIYAGLDPNKITPSPDGWPSQEILDQIAFTRLQQGTGGTVLFSMRTLMRSPDSLAERLIERVYSERTVPPPSSWLDSSPPAIPFAIVSREKSGALGLRMKPRGRERPWLWLVRTRSAGKWSHVILPGWMREYRLSSGSGTATNPDLVLVSAFDRMANEGWRAILWID